MSIRPLFAMLFVAAIPAAQAQQHEHAATAAPRATLTTGLGRLHHAIATKNADAQRFFDQGLTYVYGFNHDEAIRSFRRADIVIYLQVKQMLRAQ